MKVSRQFERRGPLYVPRYDVDPPGRRYERYRRRWAPRASFVQGQSGAYVGSGPYTSTFGSSNTAGNLLYCLYNGLGSALPTISDTQGNTWLRLFSDTTGISGEYFTAWSAVAIGGSATVITVAQSFVTGLGGICAGEWGSVNTLDQNPTPADGTTNTPSITTAHAVETLIAAWGGNTSYSGGGSVMTFRIGIQSSGSYYAIVADLNVTSIQTSFSTSPSGGSGGVAAISSFYAASAASAFPPLNSAWSGSPHKNPLLRM